MCKYLPGYWAEIIDVLYNNSGLGGSIRINQCGRGRGGNKQMEIGDPLYRSSANADL